MFGAAVAGAGLWLLSHSGRRVGRAQASAMSCNASPVLAVRDGQTLQHAVPAGWRYAGQAQSSGFHPSWLIASLRRLMGQQALLSMQL